MYSILIDRFVWVCKILLSEGVVGRVISGMLLKGLFRV